MGSPRREPERRPGEDQVDVTLTSGFWMGKHEVTQGQWKRVIGPLPGKLTAELPDGDDYPVGNVNFAEAEAFCDQLTKLGHRSGLLPEDWECRLPTEAQWEYACRAGTTTATAFGDSLSSHQANFKGRPYNGAEAGPSLNRAAKVGSYPANAWGLHDMHGNAYEWCRDWYHLRLPGGADPDLHDAKSTASRSENGDVSRVRRGGCWADDGWPCRSAFRLRFEPERRYDHIGLRIVVVRSPRITQRPVATTAPAPALELVETTTFSKALPDGNSAEFREFRRVLRRDNGVDVYLDFELVYRDPDRKSAQVVCRWESWIPISDLANYDAPEVVDAAVHDDVAILVWNQSNVSHAQRFTRDRAGGWTPTGRFVGFGGGSGASLFGPAAQSANVKFEDDGALRLTLNYPDGVSRKFVSTPRSAPPNEWRPE